MAYGGLVYFQKVSGYSGDTVSPEHKLSVENIDNNFFNLKSQDIKNITVEDATLVVERWDCEQNIRVDLPVKEYYTKTECNALLKTLKEYLEEKIDDTAEELNEKMDVLSGNVHTEVAQMKEYVDGKITIQSATTKQAIETLNTAFSAFTDCVNERITSISNDFQVLTATTQSQLSTMKAELFAKFATLEITFDRKLEELSYDICTLETSLNERITKLENETNEKLDKFQNEDLYAISLMLNNLSDRIDKLSIDKTVEINRAKEECNRYTNKKIEEAISESSAQLRQEMLDDKSELNIKIGQTKSELEASIEKCQEDSAEYTDQEVAKADTKVRADLSGEIASTESRLDAKIDRTEESLSSVIQNNYKSLSGYTNSKVSELSDAVDTKIENAVKECKEYTDEKTRKLESDITSATTSQISSVKVELTDKINLVDDKLSNAIIQSNSAITEYVDEKIDELSGLVDEKLSATTVELKKHTNDTVKASSEQLDSQLTAKIAQVKRDAESKIEEVESDLCEKIQESQEESSAYTDTKVGEAVDRLEGMIEVLSGDTASKCQAANQRISDVEYSTNIKINSVKNELTETINDLDSSVDDRISTSKTEIEGEISSLNYNLTHKIDELAEKTSHDICVVEQQYQEADSQLNVKIEKNKQDIAELDEYTRDAIEEMKSLTITPRVLTVAYDEEEGKNYGEVYGEGNYIAKTIAVLTAKNNNDGLFIGWATGDIACGNIESVDTTNPLKVYMDKSKTVVAVFRKRLAFTLLNDNPEMGSIRFMNYDKDEILRDEEITYYVGKDIHSIISPIENRGYAFDKWSDNVKTMTRSIMINKDTTLKAIFVSGYTLDVELQGAAAEVIVKDNYENTKQNGCAFKAGETATIEIRPASGHSFVKWEDESTANPRTITMDGNKTLKAICV